MLDDVEKLIVPDDLAGASLRAALERADTRALMRLGRPPAGMRPPQVLVNPKWLRPFETFAREHGLTLDLAAPRDIAREAVIIGGKMMDATYGEFQDEMDLFNRAFCEVMMAGDAKGRVFTFPIPTYNITKDFNWDNPNLAPVWQMTGKYGIPYFSNFVNSDMSPEDARSMCCRLRLDNRELLKRGGGLFGANPLTGSIGVIGAGPAGLAAAVDLAREGFPVTIFEREKEGGGLLRYGIGRLYKANPRYTLMLVAHKLGAPGNPEYAIGAVAEDGTAIVDERLVERLGIPPEYVEVEQQRQQTEVERRAATLRGGRDPVPVSGRICVVVDDGAVLDSRVGVVHVQTTAAFITSAGVLADQAVPDDAVALLVHGGAIAIGLVAVLRDPAPQQLARTE